MVLCVIQPLLVPFRFAARLGPWALIIGLAVGILLPGLASTVRLALMPLIAGILFVSVLRLDPAAVAGALGHARQDVPTVLVLQLGLPLTLAALVSAAGWAGPFAAVLILTVAAAPIAGGAGLAALTGLDGATALRLLVWGTALIPVTSILPLRFALAESPAGIWLPALKLLFIVALSGGAALAVRRWLFARPSSDDRKALDGAGAILLSAMVVGLMDEIQPMLVSDPLGLLQVFALACAVNFGLQLVTALSLKPLGGAADRRGAVALVAGNRNLALFLVALPPTSMDAMMVFVGCYQIPMFLTPLVMRRFYRSLG